MRNIPQLHQGSEIELSHGMIEADQTVLKLLNNYLMLKARS